jgi:hypothetical protein
MSCCGKKRSSVSSLPAKPASAVPSRAFAGIAPPARGSEFEYLGGNVLTVIGPGSRLRYRFVGHGSRVTVDARDRASLARLPQLREIPTRN